jgi:hypothetical protein
VHGVTVRLSRAHSAQACQGVAFSATERGVKIASHISDTSRALACLFFVLRLPEEGDAIVKKRCQPLVGVIDADV